MSYLVRIIVIVRLPMNDVFLWYAMSMVVLHSRATVVIVSPWRRSLCSS